MALVKLDCGNYINPEMIAWIGIDLRHANSLIASTIETDKNLYRITPADRDRIVAAMGTHTDADLPEPYAWETKEGELRYSRKGLAEYNRVYNNSQGLADSLYTVDQMRAALGITEATDDDTD